MSNKFDGHNHASDGLRSRCRKCEWPMKKKSIRKARVRKWKARDLRKKEARGLTNRNTVWMTKDEVRAFFFRCTHRVIKYWEFNGLFLPDDLVFPRPIIVGLRAKGYVRKYGKAKWKRADIKAFMGELLRRKDEIRACLRNVKWGSLKVIAAEVRRKRAKGIPPWTPTHRNTAIRHVRTLTADLPERENQKEDR